MFIRNCKQSSRTSSAIWRCQIRERSHTIAHFTCLIPERKGNKLAFSFANILNGSKIALLFVVPGTNEILRVHGVGSLVIDANLNKALASKSTVLTEASPSCGSAVIYDGSFSGMRTAGEGVTTALLRRHGISVFSQHEIELADKATREGFESER